MQQVSSGASLTHTAALFQFPLLCGCLRHRDSGCDGGNWSSIRISRGHRYCWTAADDPPQTTLRVSCSGSRCNLVRCGAFLPPIRLPCDLLLRHHPFHGSSTHGRLRRRPPLPVYSRLSDGCGGGGLDAIASDSTAAAAGVFGAAAGFAATEVVRDSGAACFSLAGAYCLVLAFDNLTKRRLHEQALSRKLVHVLSGVLFLLTWPMFSSSPEARFFAAVVPVLNCLRLLAYGLAVAKDDTLIKSITRQGRREELLRGPLFYVLVLLVSVLVFWRDSPVGLLAVCMMSGGDGFADIVGRRFGSAKLPFNKHKSWAGSISMFVFGLGTSLGMLYYFWAFGYLPSLDSEAGDVALKVACIALVATVVESLPLTDSVDDNVSVPLASMLAAMVAFGGP